jgi:hypothetical protein
VKPPKWFRDAFASQINRLRHLLVNFAGGGETAEADARRSGLVWIALRCSQ